MPFYGPFALGSGGLSQDQLNTFGADLRRQFPGITSMTTYPGAVGMTAGLGFTHPGPLLFPGQTPSGTSPIQASPPSVIGGPGAFAPFESLTALLSSGGTGPGGTVPSVAPSQLAPSQTPGFNFSGAGEGESAGTSAPGGSPTGPPGISSGGFSMGDVGQAGLAGLVSGISTPGFGIPGVPGFGLGSPTTGSSIGNAVGTVTGLGLGIPGLGIIGSGIGGMIGQAVANAQAEADMGIVGQQGFGPTSGLSGPVGEAAAAAAVSGQGEASGIGGVAGVTGGAPGTGSGEGSAPAGEASGQPGGEGGVPGGESGDGGAGGGGGAGGATVICTELYHQGLMSHVVWEADCAFGRQLDPAIYAGYHRWAPTVARWMRQSRIVTALIRVPAMAWAYEMARVMGVPGARGSLLGKFIMHVGGAVCRILGRRAVLAHAR